MPAYTTITMSVDKTGDKETIRKFYESFLNDDVQFKSVLAWGCDPNLSLNEIIKWNQRKLDENFVLADDQDVSHDFRQVLLDVNPFSECRLIVSNDDNELSFRCIVPEDEISPKNAVTLSQACLRVWSSLPIKLIESYGEFDSGVGYSDVQLGVEPSALVFSIIDEGCEKNINLNYYIHKKLKRGYFLEPREDLNEPVAHTEIKVIAEMAQRIIDRSSGALEGAMKSRSALGQNRFAGLQSKVTRHIDADEVDVAVEHLVNLIEETGVTLPQREYRKLCILADYFGYELSVEQ